jgi:hypothetical protein
MTQVRALLLAVLVLPVLALAAPTGLNAMPTAEVLAIGEARVQYETDGSGKLFVPPDGALYGTQVGLLLGLEGGVDEVVDKGTVYNLKWRMQGEGMMRPAIAIGVQNVTPDEKPQFYVVATKSFSPASVSAGVLYDGNTKDYLTMVGGRVRYKFLNVRADSLRGGALDRTALGADLIIANFFVSATAYDYRNAPNETSYSLGYRYSAY